MTLLRHHHLVAVVVGLIVVVGIKYHHRFGYTLLNTFTHFQGDEFWSDCNHRNTSSTTRVSVRPPDISIDVRLQSSI
jgi:hypothetical protein